MKVILLLLFFVSKYSLKGQVVVLKTKLIDENYTWKNYTISQIDSFYFSLQPIQNSDYKTHIRISLTGQKIDFFSDDKVNFKGVLTNHTVEYKTFYDKENKQNNSIEYQKVFEQIQLDPINVQMFISKFFESGQLNLQTDSLIPNWKTGFLHCSGILYQLKIDNDNTFQRYPCPWGQNDSLKAKEIILNNYNDLKSIFKLDSLYDSFIGKLEGGKTYSNDSYVFTYKFNDKQLKQFSKTKPLREYLFSIKDTVDYKINLDVNNQKFDFDEIAYYYMFDITISKNGKLEKIELSNGQKPKLKESLNFKYFLDDKKKIRICKKEFRTVCKKIDLGFLNLEYKIYRTIFFDKNLNEFKILDETVYLKNQ